MPGANSAYSTLACLFQEYGLGVSDGGSVALSRNGPFSEKSPAKEDAPGPPFVHMKSGSAAGSPCDSTR